MYLVTAATEFEMQPFLVLGKSGKFRSLLTGIGPVETAVRVSSWLHQHEEGITGVINFGVAGAYPRIGRNNGPGMLDICLAEREVLGDLGICLQDRLERFTGKTLGVRDTFDADPILLTRARNILRDERLKIYSGTFVTVNCASGTANRGNMLARQFGGMCENMEGAAVARVCSDFDLPWVEIRCISNIVEDRDTNRWKLKEACRRAAQVASLVATRLSSPPELS